MRIHPRHTQRLAVGVLGNPVLGYIQDTQIRKGMEQFGRGEGIALAEAEKKLRKKHGFSR